MTVIRACFEEGLALSPRPRGSPVEQCRTTPTSATGGFRRPVRQLADLGRWCHPVRRVLAQQPVGVHVGPALPGPLGYRRRRPDAGVDGDCLCLATSSPRPGQRSLELLGELLDLGGKRGGDAVGRRVVRLPQVHEAAAALDQRGDVAVADPDTMSPSQWPGTVNGRATSGRLSADDHELRRGVAPTRWIRHH